MKINIDMKKVTDSVQDITKKTSEAGKRASLNIQQKAKDIAEKTKNDSYMRRLKKYNPLFMEKYQSEDFNIPNMVVIVDDAVRRGIDVCEGAIGWLGNENGMEVMYLYDEMADKIGIKFVPVATCDTIYYVDKFDRSRFIQVDCIFNKAHEERLAELEYIAYSLGAKSFSVEIRETSAEVEVSKRKISAKRGGTAESISASSEATAQSDYAFTGKIERSGKIEAKFDGSNNVKIPELKWFKYDDSIKHLIEMRCDGVNNIKSKTLILEGAVSATMSKKTAFAIDNAISEISSKSSIGTKGKSDMEKQATKENSSKMIFNIEF